MSRKKQQTLPFVNRVTSNLKSPNEDGAPWTVELGQKTLILGDNTSHKSAVLQAVELALTGAADDIVGRFDVKDPSLLLTLAPGDTLTSMAQFSADSIGPATYNVERSGSRVKKPTHDTGFDARHVMPHRLVKAAIAGSEKTARKAFLEWTADEVSLQDVLGKLPTKQHDRYKDLAEKICVGGSAVDQLLAVTEYAGKQQRDAAKQVKGAEAAMKSAGEDLGAQPLDDQLEAAEKAVLAAQAVYDEAIQGHTKPTNDEIELRYASAVEAVEPLKQRCQEIEQRYNELMDSVRVAEIAARLFEWATHNNLDNCPACNHAHGNDHNSALFDHWRETWSNENTKVHQQAERLSDEFQQAETDLHHSAQEVATLANLRGKGRESNASELVFEDAQEKLNQAQETFRKLVAEQSRWSDLKRMQDTINTMTLEAEHNKLLKSSCEVAVGCLLTDQATRFADLVGTYLPDSWNFGIDLKDGNREVFRMGIRRGDKLHCALSGAESAAVVSAIAMATINGSSEPRVIIPEDRAWDPKTLGSVMRSLGSFPGQVIMASTIRPKGRMPAGWTVLDVGECFAGKATESDEPSTDESNESPSVSVRSAKILEGMGFGLEQVQRMTSDTAADIIRQNLGASQVTITKSGKYRVVKQANVLPLPPNK